MQRDAFLAETGRRYPQFSDPFVWLDNIYPLDCNFSIISESAIILNLQKIHVF